MIKSHQNLPIHPALTPYVKSIDIELFNPNTTSDALSYRVLPDFFVVLGFQCGGSLYILEQDTKRQLFHCGISGMQTQYRIFQPETVDTKTVLVTLYPWSINAFFREDAYQFTNQALGLTEIIKRSSVLDVEEQLNPITEPSELACMVQRFLLNLLKTNKAQLPPPAIINLVQQFPCFDTMISVEQLAKKYAMSKRSLERKLKSIIGITPKQFLRLSQFRQTLQQIQNGAHWEYLIDHLNYYDQAHIINSFKQFSGFTPGQFHAAHIALSTKI